MSFHSWLQNLRSTLTPRRRQPDRRHGSRRATTLRLNVEHLEDRCVPALYAVTDLGTLGENYSSASDLNEAGQVVGSSGSWDGNQHAFVWDNGTMVDLGTLGGYSSWAAGINDQGQVVGSAYLPDNVTLHAFLVEPQGGVWFQDSDLDGRNDYMIDLGALTENGTSEAADINNAGQVVGSAYTADGNRHAFLWDAASGMVDLGTPLGYQTSGANAINELGQVTGSAGHSDGLFNNAFLWDAANGMTVLGAGIYSNSAATDINDQGQFVGYQWDAFGPYYHHFLWTPDSPNGHDGNLIDMGMLPGEFESFAYGINNAGRVVGESWVEVGWDSYPRAFVWDAEDGMVNLQNRLLPGSGVTLTSAVAINDGGAIVVSGYTNELETRAYLLTPLPPSTPLINIADALAITEGNTGTRTATFTVTLSVESSQSITVNYATAAGTALAGSDYQSASGVLTFAPGEISKDITVPIVGDRLPEPNESFFVNITSPNAIIDDAQGRGTILDDEPRISVGDVSKSEGRNGKTLFSFTVTLTVPGSSLGYDQAVTMSFRTLNGSAQSGSDFIAKTGTLTFAPGETTKTITIEVKGDSKKESNETFYLDLSGLSSIALFTKNRGVGTIVNDD